MFSAQNDNIFAYCFSSSCVRFATQCDFVFVSFNPQALMMQNSHGRILLLRSKQLINKLSIKH